MRKIDKCLVQIVPSQRQLEYQQLEFYSFIHFTINTFTGKEWGTGTENPSIFNPTKFDAGQWVNAIKSAEMTGLILTCKHHDGFCLWPSKYTNHTIANSPYKNGKGDIVKEVSDACKEAGIKFGVYLSPWDRNNQAYGKGELYDDFFVNQLTELLTNYGEIFSVWFDGACGEGSNGKKQVYDWERYYKVIRTLQPKACISVCGPDIRWCGNEAGHTRQSEWSVVPRRTSETELIASNSQKEDNQEFRQRKITASDQDLGSREILKDEMELIWYPAEVNTSIRPGWFYHEEEDNKVRTLEELINIYYNSVGGNATFLLNIPPTKEGLFHENDVKRLHEMGDYLRQAFRENLLDSAELYANTYMNGYGIENVRTDDYETYFKTEDGITDLIIELSWEEKQVIRHIVMKENIACSQRIEKYLIEVNQDGEYRMIYEGTVVGYKRIVPLDAVETDKIRIHILDARVAPTLSFIGVY
ncbi:MAG: alpha-L-fucosidase [Firmicutes bacterium]|nr:alpha-L-fucosidase [Bacillota bacterium]